MVAYYVFGLLMLNFLVLFLIFWQTDGLSWIVWGRNASMRIHCDYSNVYECSHLASTISSTILCSWARFLALLLLLYASKEKWLNSVIKFLFYEYYLSSNLARLRELNKIKAVVIHTLSLLILQGSLDVVKRV